MIRGFQIWDYALNQTCHHGQNLPRALNQWLQMQIGMTQMMIMMFCRDFIICFEMVIVKLFSDDIEESTSTYKNPPSKNGQPYL